MDVYGKIKWIRTDEKCAVCIVLLLASVASPIKTKEYGRHEFLINDHTGSIYVSYYDIVWEFIGLP